MRYKEKTATTKRITKEEKKLLQKSVSRTGLVYIEWSQDIHLYHVIWTLHCKSPVLSVLDLTLEYVKTMPF